MSKATNGTEAPGAESTDEISKEMPSIKTIEKWLTDDLQRCIALLMGIQQDVELKRYMAVWFEGRINNAKNKAEIDKAQHKLFDE